MSKIKGAIFDFNGVIVDDYDLQKKLWNESSIQLRGRELSKDEIPYVVRGHRADEMMNYLLKESPEAHNLQELLDKRDVMKKKLILGGGYFHLMKGIEGFLEDLKQYRIPRTIATSAAYRNINFYFEYLKLDRWFDFGQIVYADGSFPGKPAPDSFLLAAQKLHLLPEECVVFEDALSGIEAANLAGVKNIVVINNDKRLARMTNVKQMVTDFTQLSVSEIFE